jgi:hypothetical protein
MAAVTERLERLPYDEIREQANQMRPARSLGRAIATLFVGFFYMLGWTAGAFVYCLAATKTGYRDGAQLRRVPTEPQPPAQAELSKL